MGTSQGVHTIALVPNPYGGIGITVTSGLVERQGIPPRECCVQEAREVGEPVGQVEHDNHLLGVYRWEEADRYSTSSAPP